MTASGQESFSILALGNTASVLSTLARYVDGLTVAYPSDEVYLSTNAGCVLSKELRHPYSISLLGYVREKSRSYKLFHSQLGYALACLQAGVPYGLHLHGSYDIAMLFPQSALGRNLMAPYRDVLQNAEYVFSHPAIARLVTRLRADIQVFNLPVDTAEFNPNIEPIALERNVFLSPDRMDRSKGHEYIWQALAMMNTKEKVKILQCNWGAEPEYTRFRAQAPPNVRFIPLVPRGRIARYYRGSTVVLGQMLNGPGMVELEAAACGIPVTVYSKDVDTPFLPKTRDSQALADVLDRLVEDQTFKEEYARKCMEYVLKNHAAELVAREFLRVVKGANMTTRKPQLITNLPRIELGTGFELFERVFGHGAHSTLWNKLVSA